MENQFPIGLFPLKQATLHMQIHRLYTLRPKEVQAIYSSLGGKYGYRERLARNGNGSPRLYYLDGHPEIDRLRDRATDELRLNFEEFRNGLLVGITERTEPYILPLRPADIHRISIHLTRDVVEPVPGSFFDWLLRHGVALSIARFFARQGEHEAGRTELRLTTGSFSIHCWADAREHKHLLDFFGKSVVEGLVVKTAVQVAE